MNITKQSITSSAKDLLDKTPKMVFLFMLLVISTYSMVRATNALSDREIYEAELAKNLKEIPIAQDQQHEIAENCRNVIVPAAQETHRILENNKKASENLLGLDMQ